MSDERLQQDELKDEDVEAHRKMARAVAATDEPGTDDSDDVEAHRKMARAVAATDEPGTDDSDDVEAHRKQA
jgi:hypothetical protein